MVRKWLQLIFGVLAFIAAAALIGVVIALFNPSYGAQSCPPPDPRGLPIVRLARGEIRDLAALVWAEARGEPDPYCSMQAVAAVVVNRLRTNPTYFGASITQVINRPFAFSPFGRDDPQRRKMMQIDERDSLYLTAMLASIAAVSGADPTRDRTNDGATHFYSGRAPAWAARMVVTRRLGGHTFLRPRD